MVMMIRVLVVVVMFMLSMTFPLVQTFLSGVGMVAVAYFVTNMMGNYD